MLNIRAMLWEFSFCLDDANLFQPYLPHDRCRYGVWRIRHMNYIRDITVPRWMKGSAKNESWQIFRVLDQANILKWSC